MWIELVQSVCSEYSVGEPADEGAISDANNALLISPPSELKSLWLEADGILDKYGDGIWSVEETIQQNLDLWSYPDQNDLYMSFGSMFCFAGAGNGDLYFFPIQGDGKINRADIFLWNHETDSREWAAANLQQFVKAWFSGSLSDSEDEDE